LPTLSKIHVGLRKSSFVKTNRYFPVKVPLDKSIWLLHKDVEFVVVELSEIYKRTWAIWRTNRNAGQKTYFCTFRVSHHESLGTCLTLSPVNGESFLFLWMEGCFVHMIGICIVAIITLDSFSLDNSRDELGNLVFQASVHFCALCGLH